MVAGAGSSLDRGWWSTARRIALSIFVAALILVVDILSHAKGMAGVLYVPLLVAIATEARRREIMLFGLLGIGFALFANLFVRRHTPGIVTYWPLGVGLVSVVITSLFLARLVGSREALAHSEWRYRSIFEQTRFPFWERDFSATLALYERLRADGVTNLLDHYRQCPDLYRQIGESVVTLDFNAAMMELVGATSRAQFPRTLADMRVNPVTMMTTQQAIFDGGRLIDGRVSLTTRDGEIKDIWVRGEISRAPERAGIEVGFLVDLTEQERSRQTLALARAELARASRVATVGALSVSIAHELNQPLAAIVMNAQTCLRYLRRAPPDIEAAIAAAERAANEGIRAGHVVRETRDLATNRVADEELVDLADLTREVLALLDPDIRDAVIEVEVRTSTAAIELVADRVAFQQVLVNLIGNAVCAMKDWPAGERRLTIDLGRAAGDVVIAVRDTGPGIAAENLARLFEPFFTTKRDGVGVGLAISRAAIEARGGHLSAANSEGGGAVFECRVPVQREPA